MASNAEVVKAIIKSLDAMDTRWEKVFDGDNLSGLKYYGNAGRSGAGYITTSPSFILPIFPLHGRFLVKSNSWISFEDAENLSVAVQGFLSNKDLENENEKRNLAERLFNKWLN